MVSLLGKPAIRMGIIENIFCDMKEGRGVRCGTVHYWRNVSRARGGQGGKKCQNCGIPFRDFSEVQADHTKQWIVGGKTSLSIGRALCENCN